MEGYCSNTGSEFSRSALLDSLRSVYSTQLQKILPLHKLPTLFFSFYEAGLSLLQSFVLCTGFSILCICVSVRVHLAFLCLFFWGGVSICSCCVLQQLQSASRPHDAHLHLKALRRIESSINGPDCHTSWAVVFAGKQVMLPTTH